MTTHFVLLTFHVSVIEELLLGPPAVVDDIGDIDPREALVLDSNEQVLADGCPVTTAKHVPFQIMTSMMKNNKYDAHYNTCEEIFRDIKKIRETRALRSTTLF